MESCPFSCPAMLEQARHSNDNNRDDNNNNETGHLFAFVALLPFCIVQFGLRGAAAASVASCEFNRVELVVESSSSWRSL